MTITIKLIDKNNEEDIRLANEPFSLFGRFIPSYQNEQWLHEVEYFEKVTEMCFPDESYDYDLMSKNSFFIGAYDGDTCVGLAVIQEGFFKYMYLYDLKVNQAYRKQNIAHLLMDKASQIAEEKKYQGIYTQGQDNNLGACLFYLKNGFVIGGLDTKVYQGTPQEHKKDIIFYKDN